MKDRREIKRDYQQAWLPKGVYQLRNTVNGKVLIGSSLNLPAMKNRIFFGLRQGDSIKFTKDLLDDWRKYGEDTFVFEVLDELEPADDPGRDYADEVKVLEELWLDKLRPFGERGYNRKPKPRS